MYFAFLSQFTKCQQFTHFLKEHFLEKILLYGNYKLFSTLLTVNVISVCSSTCFTISLPGKDECITETYVSNYNVVKTSKNVAKYMYP